VLLEPRAHRTLRFSGTCVTPCGHHIHSFIISRSCAITQSFHAHARASLVLSAAAQTRVSCINCCGQPPLSPAFQY
jgi:hypothetical protein